MRTRSGAAGVIAVVVLFGGGFWLVGSPAYGRQPAARSGSINNANIGASKKIELNARYGKLPLSFEPNLGQADPQARFISRGNGYVLSLNPDAAVLTLHNPSRATGTVEELRKDPGSTPAKVSLEVLRIRLGGADRQAKIAGTGKLKGIVNYLIGRDPTKWHTNIPTYAKVQYTAVYPGIDLVYYGSDQRQLEYDFIVKPGADPKAIALQFEGAARLDLDARGDLHAILADGGEVIHHAPIVYQERGGRHEPVEGKWVLDRKATARFALAAYDRSRAVYIDPTLAYSTYLGGSGNASQHKGDLGNAIAIDSNGSAYVTGSTLSANFPTTSGVLQTSSVAVGQGLPTAFVSKLSTDGTGLVFSTYLGGGGIEFGNSGDPGDFGNAIAVAANGSVVYVTGSTGSLDFPISQTAFGQSLNGTEAAFATALNSTGTALVYSTYLSGSNVDRGRGIAVDSNGLAYVTGETFSSNYPTTTGAFQVVNKALAKSGNNAFVTKLAANGSSLTYSTFIGGSLGDRGNAIAIDSGGFAYITGDASSSNFPTTSGVFQTTNNSSGGANNAFVTKLATNGKTLTYSTYLGGSVDTHGRGIAVDSLGFAYVTGYTGAANFPTTSGVFQTVNNAAALSGNNAFVTKLNTTATALTYSTLLGGSKNDLSNAIAIDASGSACIVGTASSSDFPTTPGAFQTSLNGSTSNAFVSKLSPAADQLFYSSYLGGTGKDEGLSVALDSLGFAYLTGDAFSTNFPVSMGAFQSSNNGSGNSANNAFISKIAVATTSSTPTPTATATATPAATPTPTATATATATRTPVATATSAATATATATPGSTTTASATATPTAGATATATATSAATATATPTAGATATATSTPGPTATATATPTAAATATPTPTTGATATATPTSAATATATPTSAATATATPTSAATASPTPTSGMTGTPTATPTAVATATATATSVPTVTATPTPIAPTTLTAAPRALNFGNVNATGTSNTKKVTLTNRGAAAAMISSVTASVPFTVSGAGDTCTGQTVAPRGRCSFLLLFAPTAVANITGGSINVTYNGTSPVVTLRGNGTAVALNAARARSLGTASAGASGRSTAIAVSNRSRVPVILGTATVGGTDPSSFTITSDSCSTQALAAKGKCSIEVQFTPGQNATGSQTGSVSLGFTYGSNNGGVSTSLSGRVR